MRFGLETQIRETTRSRVTPCMHSQPLPVMAMRISNPFMDCGGNKGKVCRSSRLSRCTSTEPSTNKPRKVASASELDSAVVATFLHVVHGTLRALSVALFTFSPSDVACLPYALLSPTSNCCRQYAIVYVSLTLRCRCHRRCDTSRFAWMPPFGRESHFSSDVASLMLEPSQSTEGRCTAAFLIPKLQRDLQLDLAISREEENVMQGGYMDNAA